MSSSRRGEQSRNSVTVVQDALRSRFGISAGEREIRALQLGDYTANVRAVEDCRAAVALLLNLETGFRGTYGDCPEIYDDVTARLQEMLVAHQIGRNGFRGL